MPAAKLYKSLLTNCGLRSAASTTPTPA